MNIVQEISRKSASLPFEAQREILDFLEFVSSKQPAETNRQSFESVRGVLKNRNFDNLENDLTEVRREMWQNFPREESK